MPRGDRALAAGRPGLDAKVLAHSWRPAALRTGLSYLRQGVRRATPVVDARALDDGDVIDGPGRLRFLAAPGHTPGGGMFLGEDGVLFTGDVLVTLDPFSGRRGPRTLPAFDNADHPQALASLDVVARSGASVLLPGHGEPGGGTPPTPWPRPVARQRERSSGEGERVVLVGDHPAPLVPAEPHGQAQPALGLGRQLLRGAATEQRPRPGHVGAGRHLQGLDLEGSPPTPATRRRAATSPVVVDAPHALCGGGTSNMTMSPAWSESTPSMSPRWTAVAHRSTRARISCSCSVITSSDACRRRNSSVPCRHRCRQPAVAVVRSSPRTISPSKWAAARARHASSSPGWPSGGT